MNAALDTEQCTGCPDVLRCSRWTKDGEVDYLKRGCRPVKTNLRPRIIEEPIRNRKPISKIIDADEQNKNRFRLMDLK
jgi:hypothetical protein